MQYFFVAWVVKYFIRLGNYLIFPVNLIIRKYIIHSFWQRHWFSWKGVLIIWITESIYRQTENMLSERKPPIQNMKMKLAWWQKTEVRSRALIFQSVTGWLQFLFSPFKIWRLLFRSSQPDKLWHKTGSPGLQWHQHGGLFPVYFDKCPHHPFFKFFKPCMGRVPKPYS